MPSFIEEMIAQLRAGGVEDLPPTPERTEPRRAPLNIGLPSSEVIPNQWVVILRETLGEAADPAAVAREMAGNHGLSVQHIYTTAVKGFSARIPSQALEQIKRNPRVAFVTEDAVVRAAAQTVPSGVKRVLAHANSTAKINNLDERVDIDVAILDSGVNLTHPDLNVVGGVSFIAGETPNDEYGHGTHIGGIIGALDNDMGVVGVAPGARLHAVKVLPNYGTGTYATLLAGVDWVTANAAKIDVAVLSLNLSGRYDDGNCGLTNMDPLHTAICKAVGLGVTFVVAAGNWKSDAQYSAPASYNEVITVSALDDQDGTPLLDTLAWFSNFGADVDLTAPGVSIYSTYKNGGYAYLSGTSQAAAHVAGAAALYKANNPSVTPAHVRQALLDTAEKRRVAWDGDCDGFIDPVVSVRNTPVGPYDPAKSLLRARPSTIEADGESRTEILHLPLDTNEIPLGPRQKVVFASNAGTLLTNVSDEENGVYRQPLLSSPRLESAMVSGVVNGVSFPAQSVVHFTEDLLRGTNFPLSTVGWDFFRPAGASDGKNYFVVWSGMNTHWNRWEVYGTRVAPDGTILDPKGIPISSSSSRYEYDPQVAFDGINYFVVWREYWWEYVNGSYISHYNMVGARIRAVDGIVLDQTPIVIATGSNANGNRRPTLSFDGQNFVVVWADYENNNAGIYGARVRVADAAVLDPNGIRITTTTAWESNPTIISHNNISFIVWADSGAIYGKRMASDGTMLDATPIKIASSPVVQSPRLSYDGQSYFVLWTQLQGASSEIYGRRIRASDLTFLDTTPIQISPASGDQFRPSVAFNGVNYLVTWTDLRDSKWEIYGTRVRAWDGRKGQKVILDPEGFRFSQTPLWSPYSWAYDSVVIPGGDRFLVLWDGVEANCTSFKAWLVWGQFVSGVDTIPPSVSFVSPSHGNVLSQVTTAVVSATDNVQAIKVEFALDDILQFISSASPFSWTWDTRTAPEGLHAISARAYDASGNVGKSVPITVTVDNTPPSVSLTSPIPGDTAGGTLTVSVAATDNRSGIAKVEFYLDNILKATETNSPYNWSWNTATSTNGSHTLNVKAYDQAGNAGSPVPITIITQNTDTIGSSTAQVEVGNIEPGPSAAPPPAVSTPGPPPPAPASTIGDLDDSGLVDGRDLILMARAMRSRPGSARWEPRLNFNGDGVIDWADLQLLLRDFGRRVPRQ